MCLKERVKQISTAMSLYNPAKAVFHIKHTKDLRDQFYVLCYEIFCRTLKLVYKAKFLKKHLILHSPIKTLFGRHIVRFFNLLYINL